MAAELRTTRSVLGLTIPFGIGLALWTSISIAAAAAATAPPASSRIPDASSRSAAEKPQDTTGRDTAGRDAAGWDAAGPDAAGPDAAGQGIGGTLGSLGTGPVHLDPDSLFAGFDTLEDPGDRALTFAERTRIFIPGRTRLTPLEDGREGGAMGNGAPEGKAREVRERLGPAWTLESMGTSPDAWELRGPGVRLPEGP